ncbi:MAG: PAS domain S-box protein [Polyangiaceae bacterium]|nr:PAS domain S-box protein [Polyangiaceae bacterium]
MALLRTEKIEESEARFRTLFQKAPIAMGTDDGVNITAVNDKFVELTGYHADELSTLDKFAELVWPDPHERAANLQKCNAARLSAGPWNGYEPPHVEAQITRKDGARRWIEMAAFPMDAGTIVIFLDLTDRKRTEEELRESRARLVFALQAGNDGLWDWNVETNDVYYAPRWMEMLGYGPTELPSTLDTWTFLAHPDDGPAFLESARKYMAGEIPKFEVEVRLRHREGHWVHVLTRAVFARDSQGQPLKPVHLVGTNIDITERKRIELALRESEEHYRKLFEASREQAALLNLARDAIIVRDKHFHVRSWNKGAEQLYGYTAEEAVGRDVRDLILQEVHPKALEQISTIANAHGSWSGELEHRTKHGKKLIVASRWTLVRDANGEIEAVLAINTDVTEKKQLEQRFFRAQRMESLGTLAGGVAHDLNNVLAPILMSVDTLRDGETDPDRLETLAMVETAAQRGAQMIRQLLTFARGIDGTKSRINLSRIAGEVKKIVSETFPKDIFFRLEVVPDLWDVQADATQMHQLLINLCVNARDAMVHGGTLRVKLSNTTLDEVYTGMNFESKPGPYVALEVDDTGVGMPPEVLDRIFEPFFTTKPVGRGTGLGLSAVHSIARSHGGFVHVSSEVAKGTHFSVYLPAEGTSVAANPDAGPPSIPRGRGEVVLIVDDEEAVRTAATRALERYGYRTLTAANGAEAVSVYAQHRSDVAVVLTDMTMPVMDGSATIAALKVMDPSVKIIASSGLDAHGNVAKAAASGTVDFVAKPYTAETLITAIRKALRRK